MKKKIPDLKSRIVSLLGFVLFQKRLLDTSTRLTQYIGGNILKPFRIFTHKGTSWLKYRRGVNSPSKVVPSDFPNLASKLLLAEPNLYITQSRLVLSAERLETIREFSGWYSTDAIMDAFNPKFMLSVKPPNVP